MDPLTPLLGRTVVFIAHPDDETISCGALLQRVREPIVVFATDGGPQDAYFWGRYGSREAYVELRRQEAKAALAAVGVREALWLTHASGAQFQDQQLFRNLSAAFEALRNLVEEHKPDTILTLAYEGGHPDHDSCNFLGRQVADDLGLPAWEAPLYFRRADNDVLLQEFHSTNGTEIDLIPTAEEQRRKRAMCEAYVSQKGVVGIFENNLRETFRPMSQYDYSRPPHSGVLNYEAWQWPITGQQVADQFQAWIESKRRVESAD